MLVDFCLKSKISSALLLYASFDGFLFFFIPYSSGLVLSSLMGNLVDLDFS